jgi:DNA-binding NarL/FixJ family response regulator
MGLTSIRCRSLAASFDYPLKVTVGLESRRRKVSMIRLYSGREVVQLVETLRPDVVLIDTRLGGESGFDASSSMPWRSPGGHQQRSLRRAVGRLLDDDAGEFVA